jgi:hypothetical protein
MGNFMRFIAKSLMVGCLAVAGVCAAADGPEDLTEVFLQSLSERSYEEAVNKLYASGARSQQKEQLTQGVIATIKTILDTAGPPKTWEMVESKRIGKDLMGIKVLSKHKNENLMFWNVLYYRRQGTWEPIGIRLNNDATKAGFW